MQRTAVMALAAAAVATGAIGIPAAEAATLEQLIRENLRWNFNDDSAEFQVRDVDNSGTLDLQDRLRGVIKIDEFIAQPGGPAFLLNGVANSAVHGLFEIEVTSKDPTGTAGQFLYRFGPSEAFETELGVQGAMVGLWESNATFQPKDPSPGACDTIPNCEAKATAGVRQLVLGFDGDPDRDNVWGTGPVTDDLSDARLVTEGATLGTLDYRLNVLDSNLNVPEFIDVGGLSIIGDEVFDGPAHAVGSGQVQGIFNNQTPYQAFDQASITMAVVPIPAALPLFLAGLGALGMIGWRRNAA